VRHVQSERERNAARVLAEAEGAGWRIRPGRLNSAVLVAESTNGWKIYGSGRIALAGNLSARKRGEL
jgi:hypothetical protein